jgi:hypothetical protein
MEKKFFEWIYENVYFYVCVATHILLLIINKSSSVYSGGSSFTLGYLIGVILLWLFIFAIIFAFLKVKKRSKKYLEQRNKKVCNIPSMF